MAVRQSVIAAAISVVTAVSVAGCKSPTSASAEAEVDSAASVTAVEGKDGIHRVELTADAAQRIDLRTAAISARAATAGQPATGLLSAPLDAVLYDKDGKTWVFVSTGKLAFQRAPVTVSKVDGDVAVLASGPPAGTVVVTVGAAELLGAEDGVPGE